MYLCSENTQTITLLLYFYFSFKQISFLVRFFMDKLNYMIHNNFYKSWRLK